MGQRAFDANIDELLENIENTLPRSYGQLTRAAERARLVIEDVLAKYADNKGRIPRNKQAAVLRDLQNVEGQIYRDIRTELQVMFNATADATAVGLSLAVATAIDTAALLAVAGIAKTLAEPLFLFPALIGEPTREFTARIAGAPFTRKDSDGLRLNDRLRSIARTIMREVSSTLRQSIRKGEVTSQMNRKVSDNFKALNQRLKRIVETEIMYVMRNGIAKFAELSGIFKAIRIKDYPHGAPGEHERHMCYVYAHRDEHGLGQGVYPVGTRKIRNPHPQCRSTLHPVLHDRLA